MWEGGRLVGAVETVEPEWSTRDVQLMLAQDRWERTLDPNGVPLDEAMSTMADPTNYDADAWFYRVGAPLVNWAEKARRDAEAAYQKQNPAANMNGLVFQPVRVNRRDA